MRLHDYIRHHGWSIYAVAAALGVRPEAVRRYCAGERIPRPRIMAAIVALTRGEVQPADFYPQLEAAPASDVCAGGNPAVLPSSGECCE